MFSDDFLFFFNDTAPTEIYTLSLHDALPICVAGSRCVKCRRMPTRTRCTATSTPARKARTDAACFSIARPRRTATRDRKSTRLNSSHMSISYAVFCLKKKNNKKKKNTTTQQQ